MIKNFRPMLACDVVLEKLKFPVIVSPKIDGIRALVIDGKLMSRSLKPIPNKYCQKLFGKREYNGLDGELTVGPLTSPNLCHNTESGVMSVDGEPDVWFNVFDFHDMSYDYSYRLGYVNMYLDYDPHIEPILTWGIKNLSKLLDKEKYFLNMGYEGIIIRSPHAPYKYGRSTMSDQGLLRLKRFTEDEGIIIDIIEGKTNTNTKEKNELGLTKRSSKGDGMLLSGQIGTIVVQDLRTKEIHKISPGKMTKRERAHFMERPDLILGKIAKYKHFAYGAKDKLRMATFQCFRNQIDI